MYVLVLPQTLNFGCAAAMLIVNDHYQGAF
jgi:hypothetical protein